MQSAYNTTKLKDKCMLRLKQSKKPRLLETEVPWSQSLGSEHQQ